MFTEKENKIISLFYSGDYELAEQLMIATNNCKLVDKLICKIHRLLYKYKIKYEEIIFRSRDCVSSRLEVGYKNAVVLCCCNILINGYKYGKDKKGYYDSIMNAVIKMIDAIRYPEEVYLFVYNTGYFDKEELEQELKPLGVRLVLER